MSAVLTLIATIVVLVVAPYLYVNVYLPMTFWKRQKIPYIPAWPVVGSFAPVFLKREHFADFTIRTYKEFSESKIFGQVDTGKPILVVRDPDVIQQITVKHFDHFVNHSTVFFNPEVDPLMGKNLMMLKDQQWHKMRGILSPAFTGSKMRAMFQLMIKCAEQLSNSLVEQFQGEQVLEVELKSTFTKLTNDLIATTAFGLEVDSFKNPDNTFYENAKKATNFEWWRFVVASAAPWFMKLINEGVFPRSATDFFTGVISRTINQREQQGIVRPDMINLMIEAKKASIEKAKVDGDTTVLTDFDIASQAFLFFIAGYEITATTMSFACYELAVNPECQKKLHEEIDQHLAKTGGKVTYEMVQEMKYLDAVVTETLRKWSGGGGILDRLCNKDFLIKDALGPGKDYTIKEGMIVQLAAGGIQMDPKYFPDPETFDPERFYDKRTSTIDSEYFLSFGAGPRHCIGIRFAQLEVKAAIFSFLMDFEVVPIKETSKRIVLDPSSSQLVIKGGFKVGLKRRNVL